MKICLALFGLNRSLPWTHRSINERLIQPLRQTGAEVKLFAHFNLPKTIHNPRSGETQGAFRNVGLERLNIDHVLIEPQDDAQTEALWQRFRQHDLKGNDPTGSSHRNLIHQYRSQAKVLQMIQASEGDAWDAVLFARPDIEYLDTLPAMESLKWIQEKSYDMLTPTWHQWGGLNDRICLCNPRAAKIYANRVNILDEIIDAKRPMNAEGILQYTVQKNSLKNGALHIRGARVRYTGYTVDEGFQLSLPEKLRFLHRRIMSKMRRMTAN